MREAGPITCEEALGLLAALLDLELEPVDQRSVEQHLDTCRSCFSRAEFERQLKQQLTSIGRRPAEATFEHRIRAMIARFAAGSDRARSEQD